MNSLIAILMAFWLGVFFADSINTGNCDDKGYFTPMFGNEYECTEILEKANQGE